MMKYDVILLRYGEISLKSKYVRKLFETILISNIKKAFQKENIPYDIRIDRGRIYLETSEISKSITILPRIFGIVSLSPAVKTTATLQDMTQVAQQLIKDVLTKQKSFAIRVTRVGTHAFSSQDVAVHIGDNIVTTTHAQVDLKTPDIELFIEIREKNSFLFTQKIKGTGGLPLGTQGKILALVECPHSLLAAWYIMRRGCKVFIVQTEHSNIEAINAFLEYWYADAEIVYQNPQSQDWYRQLSVVASEKKCDALVTSHSLDNPSSTLSILAQFKKYNDIPILSPLIAMQSEEIILQCNIKGILL